MNDRCKCFAKVRLAEIRLRLGKDGVKKDMKEIIRKATDVLESVDDHEPTAVIEAKVLSLVERLEKRE